MLLFVFRCVVLLRVVLVDFCWFIVCCVGLFCLLFCCVVVCVCCVVVCVLCVCVVVLCFVCVVVVLC